MKINNRYRQRMKERWIKEYDKHMKLGIFADKESTLKTFLRLQILRGAK